MPDPSSQPSIVADFLATARGRLITWLTVVALVLGIATEILSLITGYYNMIKVRNDAVVSQANALEAQGRMRPGPGFTAEQSPADDCRQHMRFVFRNAVPPTETPDSVAIERRADEVCRK